MNRAVTDDLITISLNEAQSLINDPAFKKIFAAAPTFRALNECALNYKTDNEQVTGIIDRLLISNTEIVIVDYKTHRVSESEIPELIEEYTPQMRYYAEGARLAWPGRNIQSVLVFTYGRRMVEVDC